MTRPDDCGRPVQIAGDRAAACGGTGAAVPMCRRRMDGGGATKRHMWIGRW